MEAEIKKTLDDLKSFRRDLRSCSSQISEKPHGSNGSLPEDVQKELEQLRRVVGNFHPSEKSKTYRELMEENRKLEESQKKITVLSAQLAILEKDRETAEQEILFLRNAQHDMERPETDHKTRKNKKKRIRKCISSSSSSPSLSEEEKRFRLREYLLCSHRHYSDLQIRFLSGILTDDRLPAEELARLFDPAMSSGRMKQFYSLLCAKHHIPVTAASTDNSTKQNSAETFGEITEETAADTSDNSTAPPIQIEPKQEKTDASPETILRFARLLSEEKQKGR